MITKDLGMVTAYAYAVSKGYTGTEEEFAELMASYASVAQEAVDAALAAAQSAQAAESAKDTAQTTVAGAIAGIQAEGQTQIGAVQAEGTTQVGNVNTAGTTQVGAVQAKGTEVLNSIPADYSTLSGEVTGLKSALQDSPTVKESEDDADFNISDSQGHVILSIQDGDIKTKNFDSSNTEAAEAFQTFASDTQTVVAGSANTFIISHDFKKGDEIVFHFADGLGHMNYGKYAYYYEGNTVIAANRRGTNGYFRHIIKADCSSVKAIVNAGQYDAGTSLRLFVYLMEREVTPKIVTVAVDGSGMYTTIKEAVESITDANAVTNPYIIEVSPGTYNTLEGYSDETIATSTGDSTGFQGVILTNGISIRGTGMNREDTILTATLDPDEWSETVRNGISTLNIQGTGSIENLTIDANYIRYCVHDDFKTPRNEDVLRTVKNVKFTGNQLTYYPQFTTYGAGFGHPRNFYFENCDFGYDLGIHSQGGHSYSCTVEINNCTGHRLRIGDKATADTDAVHDFIVNNCNFDIILISHTSSLTKPHIRLTGTGNENTIIQCLPIDVYQLGMVDKTVSGFTVGKLVKQTSGAFGYEVTNVPDLAYGVVIFSTDEYSYIQRSGYIASNILGLTGLSVGDYVTVDNSGSIVTGGTAANAVGIVTWIDNNNTAYIKLIN